MKKAIVLLARELSELNEYAVNGEYNKHYECLLDSYADLYDAILNEGDKNSVFVELLYNKYRINF